MLLLLLALLPLATCFKHKVVRLLTGGASIRHKCAIPFMNQDTLYWLNLSAHFDTIDLDSMIVCGLTALPHDLVHESDAR